MKRMFDIFVSATGLILLSPVFLILHLLVMHKLGRPALFVQERPGQNGHPFQMYKFRSMLSPADNDGSPLPDFERLTSFGRRLRDSSLDELPELYNVLKGDMSMVGPRPLLMDYLPLYNTHQARRHEVRPGITGWAQVNGRNAISWEEKFDYDVWYVENQSFGLDMKILWLTVWRVLKRDGISAKGEATMPTFTGTGTN
jgi:lipopolysaccharide/colanic/teichoic acid biosynthesis glycosyltransferase